MWTRIQPPGCGLCRGDPGGMSTVHRDLGAPDQISHPALSIEVTVRTVGMRVDCSG